jgi:V/A-type H+/Na+-transporting ATPase subunit D
MSATVRGQPPGRAGRMWLERRLDVATRGGSLLEQKLRILLDLEERFALLEERTRAEWGAAVEALDLWVSRAGLVSGQRGLRTARPGSPAQVDVAWQHTMGVRHPAAATCALPEVLPTDAVPDSVALIEARAAAERAVLAGVDQAVAGTALAAIRTEIATTRRQLRAVQTRWIPKLEDARAQLRQVLDDQEHDEALRLRWSADAPRGRQVRR